MQPGPLPAPILITHPNQLAALAKELAREPLIAVDTESNSLYAYREQVCLVQFSTPRLDYLVDPLVLLDLSPLAPLFANPKIEKVFHAAEYDLICLKRDFDFTFENLFDTMLAARILGRKAVGLGSLLESEFGITLDKRYQRANWGQRPLPEYLLAYARLDTHYLLDLRHRLKAELEATAHWSLAAEDFQRLCHINQRSFEPEIEPDFFVSGANDLSPQQHAVLLELLKHRDRIARLQDRPLFKVMATKTLLAIAEACPSNLEALGRVPGMTTRQVQRHGKALLQAVQRGLHAEPVHPQRPPRSDERLVNRLEKLREWRKLKAQALNVESDVVLPRDLMTLIAEQNPSNLTELAQILCDVPWRLQQFGGDILQTLANGNGQARRRRSN